MTWMSVSVSTRSVPPVLPAVCVVMVVPSPMATRAPNFWPAEPMSVLICRAEIEARPAEVERSESSLADQRFFSALLRAWISTVAASIALSLPMSTSAVPASTVDIAAPLPEAMPPMARLDDTASNCWLRSARICTVCASTVLRLPMEVTSEPRMFRLESAPAMPTNRPPLEALARWKIWSSARPRMRSVPASSVTSSPSPARTTLRSVVVAEDTPTDAPELTDSACASAIDCCSPWARRSTVASPSAVTSAPSIVARTTAPMSLTTTVPAAAAAIRPKEAAAAKTSPYSEAASSARTTMPRLPRSCDQPETLPSTGCSPLRLAAAVTSVVMVL